jgi:hypothetical protein
MVTHLDVSRGDIEAAAVAVEAVMRLLASA